MSKREALKKAQNKLIRIPSTTLFGSICNDWKLNMETKFILFFGLLFNINYYCQVPEGVNKIDDNNLREGEWIIYYDEDWQEVEDSSQIEYYRKITYHKDKPIGLVCDFYKTGVKQWEGYLISDRPDIANGKVKYFYENGKLEQVGNVKNGVYYDDWNYYTFLGDFSHKSNFRRGNESGIAQTLSKAIKFLQNGNDQKAIELFEEIIFELEKFGSPAKNNFVGDYLFEIGFQLWDYRVNLNKSISLFNQSLKIYENVYGKLSNDYEATLHYLAMCYADIGDYNKSLELNLNNEILIRKLYGYDSERYATLLNNLALNYADLGDYKKAKEINIKCLNLREKLQGSNSPEYAISLNNLALVCVELGELKKSLEYNNEALGLIKQLYGEESEDYALSLGNLSLLYLDLGKYEKSLELALKTLKLREQIFGESHPDYCNSLSTVALIYSYLGEFEKSLKLNEKCLEIELELFGKIHPMYAITLGNLATIYQDLGDFIEAKKLLKECLSIREQLFGKEHPDYALTLGNLALVYSALGDYEKSLSLNKTTLDLKEKILGKNHTDYITTLGNLAVDYSDLGDFEKSLDLNYQALELTESLYGKKHPDYVLCLNNIASDYSDLGNHNKSLKMNLKCLELYESIYGKEHQDYAMSLNNLALDYSNLGLHKKSLEANSKSLAISEKIFGKNHVSYYLTLNNLALNYADMGNFKKSIDINMECLKLSEKLVGKSHPYYAMSLNNLALDYSNFKNHEKSIELNQEALVISEKVHGKDHSDYTLSLNNLAHEYFYNGQYEFSDSLLLESYLIDENIFFRNYLALSEVEKEAYVISLKESLENLVNYSLYRGGAKKIDCAVLSSFLNLKGLLLNSNISSIENVLSSNNPKLNKLYKEWRDGKVELGKYYELSLSEKVQFASKINELEMHTNKLEQQLSRSSSQFAKSQKRINWLDIKTKLKQNEAFVQILRLNKYYYNQQAEDDSLMYVAFIIDKNCETAPILIELNNSKLESESYQVYSSFSFGRKRNQLDEFSYDNYWSAISEKLKDVKRIFISSDGVYNKLNLNVLYNNHRSNYLGEELDIRLVTSGRDLLNFDVEENERKKSALTAVLFGDPEFDLISEQLTNEDHIISRDLEQYWIDSLSRGWKVSSLPGSAIEVRNISEIMQKNKWEVSSYTGNNAVEANVKNVNSPTVLHVATHGYFFNDVMLKKNKSNRTLDDDSKKAIKNPLLRSGLLFAGAKNTLNGNPPKNGDNGLLTAYEASFMNLRGTDLVVLSACETARGEIKNGEGVYGLQRAMQQAGAKNIIMSMWKVNDKVTQEFMTMFYDSWLSGSTKREAFKSTQQKIKEIYKHPYYWGAFVMIGN